MAKKTKDDPTFEDLLADAEAAVELLESGELSLEDSMEKYEQGVKNLNACAKLIAEAQKKVELLIATKEGELKLTTFDPEEDEEE